MNKKIINLTKKLVAIKSTPDNPKALDKCLALVLDNLSGYSVEYFENKGVKSILVYNSKKRPEKFKVILNGHLDIIPGKKHQYKPNIIKNKLYGVGSMDMKASIACFVAVFKEIAKKVKYPIALQLVTDEEVGGFNGTKYQIDKGLKADFVIVGESTNLKIENQTKGILWLKISNKGKTAHGAYPWKGSNSIWAMNNFLNKLKEKYPIPEKDNWATTVNLSRISTSNNTFNKIPDDCEICLDVRFIPKDSNKVLDNIKNMLPKGFSMNVTVNEPAQYVDKNNPYIKMLQKIGQEIIKKEIKLQSANGSSDARHYKRVNCDAIEFGPIGEGMGSDNEWVDIQSLDLYYQTLKSFLMSL